MQKSNESNCYVLIAALCLSFYCAKISYADECSKPSFRTGISQFMREGGIGGVGISFNKNPPTVAKVQSGDCIIIPEHLRGNRIFIFSNHRSSLKEKYYSFLAIDIVKQYKTLRFEQDVVTAIRKGPWVRLEGGEKLELDEIFRMKSFEGITNGKFSEIHSEEPFSEVGLIGAFGGLFWHGTPMESDVSSLERLSYWTTPSPNNQKVKAEKYLIRFEAVPLGEQPTKQKNGIPIDTRFDTDIEFMDVHIRSPADGGFQVNFRIQ